MISAVRSCCDRTPTFRSASPVEEPVYSPYIYAFKPHSDAVNSLALGEVGNRLLLISCSSDSSVKFHSHEEKKTIQNCIGHEREVKCISWCQAVQIFCYSFTGAFSASRDLSFALWTEKKSECIFRRKDAHELVITAIEADMLGVVVATGSRDNWIHLWDVSSQKKLSSCNRPRNLITALSWRQGTSNIVQTSENKQPVIWDTRDFSKPVVEFGCKQWIQTCCDNQGDYVLTGSNGFEGRGCELTLWDVRHPATYVSEFKGHAQTVSSCRFLPFEQNSHATSSFQFISTSHDATVVKWSSDRPSQCMNSVHPPTYAQLNSLAVLDRNTVYVGSVNGDVYLMKI